MRCGWGPYFRRTFEVQAGNSPLQGQSKPPAKLVVLIARHTTKWFSETFLVYNKSSFAKGMHKGTSEAPVPSESELERRSKSISMGRRQA